MIFYSSIKYIFTDKISKDLQANDIEIVPTKHFTSITSSFTLITQKFKYYAQLEALILTIVDIGMNAWNPQVFSEQLDFFVILPNTHFVQTIVSK